MSTKYNEEAEDLMFELFDEDDFTKVISFVDKYGCDFVDRDGRNHLEIVICIVYQHITYPYIKNSSTNSNLVDYAI